MNMAVLTDLLEFTRDGEWGSGEPDQGLIDVGIIRGTDFSSVRYGDLSGIPTRYVRASVVEKKQLKPRDILIETAGGTKDQPTGRTVYLKDDLFERANKPLLCASFARFLRVQEGAVDPRYLFWKLQDEYIREELLPFHVQHTGVARFQYTQFATNHRLALPAELEVQAAIASVLSALDDNIELNRRMNETLEALAQAIFKDWFVDFGPTRRKSEGATDPVAILGNLISDPARAAQTAALFPASFGDDGLPEGWPLLPLDRSLVLQRGFDLPKTTRTDGKFPVIAASGPSGTHNEFKVSGPGVCTGRSGVLGGIYFVREDFWPLNTSLWIKEYPNATPLYAFYLLKTLDLLALNAGSAVPTLNRNHVHQIQVTTPAMSAVRAFENFVSTLYDRIASSERENRTLAETRDYLLPKLMSGEVRVRDAEKIAG